MNKQWSAAPIIAAILLLLPLLYVGSYVVLVNPQPPSYPSLPPGAEFDGSIPAFWPCAYRYGGKSAERFFWPLEQIDRKLRPKTWFE